MSVYICIHIPDIPPSLNHYVKHLRSGAHYKTAEAERFASLVALSALEYRGLNLEATKVEMTVTLPKRAKGDIDNFPKVVLDSLVRCGVIRSDATIARMVVTKCRGEKAATEVWISD